MMMMMMIFRVEVYAKQATCINQVTFLLGLLFDPEDAGDMFFRNVG
jgi:hypothetical protein